MSNKTVVIGLTLILTLLSAYYLHFTFVARSIDSSITQKAKDKTGNVDFTKRQALFDSLWTEKVWLGETYRGVKEKELALGLDLQGGMQVTLEISPVEIIKVMSGNSSDENLAKALQQAREKQANSSRNFVDLFYESYKALSSKPLNQFFVNSVTRSMFKADASDSQIISAIKKELDSAIDRSYDILKARIDKFGVANPEIKRLAGTNRITIELPGIDNPARARKLISGTARLEFWEVAEMNEPGVQAAFSQFSNYLVKLEEKEKGGAKEKDKDDKKSGSTDLAAETDTTKGANPEKKDGKDGKDKGKDDTLKNKGKEAAKDTQKTKGKDEKKDTPKPSKYANLFSSGPQGLNALTRDTAKINKLFAESRAVSSNLKMLWDAKADEGQRVTLYFLKKSMGGKPVLEGDVVSHAQETFEQTSTNASVSMSMTTTGAKKWRKVTRENTGKRIAIVMDNAVYSAPVVQGEIPNGNSSITGNFTVEEAKDLANILKSGKMPAPTRIVEEGYVGPSLGAESVQQGIISIICGILVVFAFMTIYYSLAGTFANIAMLINLFFTMGTLAQFGSVLTLSGIAGLVLSVGMSVDANVLIYERIREEVRQGANLREAVRIGFMKALSSIIDSNVTTFLVGLILFIFGTGPVLGFATTLMIGIIASMLTSVFITRLIVEWWIGNNKRNLTFNSMFFDNSFGRTNFNFVGMRKKAYLFSAAIAVIGLGIVAAQGGFTLGVDFKGGRSYIVSFDKTIPVNDVRTEMSKVFTSGTEVKTYGKSNQLKITTAYKIEDGSEKIDQEVRGKVEKALGKFAASKPTIVSTSKVESTIAADILYKSNLAVILSVILMAVYIFARFMSWRYSVAAMISLLHNVVIVLAFIGIMQAMGIVFEIDQVLIAALLTVVGYSINDTVVVFDRIREFSGDINRADFGTQLNLAINDTLSRTIVTGTTTILNVVILLAFAGASLSGFSFSLLIGIVFGTYSSIFVASPIVLDLVGRKNTGAPAQEKESVNA